MTMTAMKRMRLPIASLAFVATLAGCGGIASSPSGALVPTVSQLQPDGAPVADAKCPTQKEITMKPCVAKLNAAKPAVTVTARGPKGGAFTVNDTGCTTRMIATIKVVKGSPDTYKISAGSHGRGQCVATFVDFTSGGKRLGAGKVIIVNNVDKKHHK